MPRKRCTKSMPHCSNACRINLGVGMIRFPDMPAERVQLCANFRVIVDFAVEDHPQGAILVAHRLRCRGRQVDDRQTPMTKADTSVRRYPCISTIRATMRHRIAHTNNLGASLIKDRPVNERMPAIPHICFKLDLFLWAPAFLVDRPNSASR